MARRGPSDRRSDPGKTAKRPLPSPDPATNLVIADVVLRGASVLLRRRLEKGLLTGQLASDKAKRMVEKRGVMGTALLWGASRLATRSPLGLAVVAGGLAAKVFYDRGKRLEKNRGAARRPDGKS